MSRCRADVLSIDFETASTADLKRTGAALYAEHPATQVLCMAWAFNDEPVAVWRPGEEFPARVRDHIGSGGDVQAWNAGFEYVIWNQTLCRQVPGLPSLSLAQLHDTMARAANYGLPLSLDAAASAARVSIPKDKDGHSLMLRMCRPRKVNPDGSLEWWHETDPERYNRLCQYCATDVEAERQVANSLPPMSDRERSIWLLDQRINSHGVVLDLNLVAKLRDLATYAADRGNTELQALTQGAVSTVNAHAALLAWVQTHGYPEDNLRRATVEARLEDPACRGLERQALELRADIARTSAAKLDAMLGCAKPLGNGSLGLVRGMLQYYGAFRTGRWAGRLVQPQNMPRGVIPGGQVPAAIQIVQQAASTAEAFTALEVLFGPVMGVVSSLLRSCIVSPLGRQLTVADFSQIEARVLPWLAGDEATLQVFARWDADVAAGRDGVDIYMLAAASIFNVRPEDVTKSQRQIGKVAVLALGYQGGVGAFQTMASAYGVELSDDQADEIKTAWRAANPLIVDLWWALDRAARTVLRDHTQVVHAGAHLRVGMVGADMVIVLPSGRPLFYRDARLVSDPDSGREEISYMGQNQYTRKWERLRTYGGKLVENVTQATARDVMADAMLAADRAGLDLILTVHDELLADTDPAPGSPGWAELQAIMSQPPAWAPGLPVGCDGWEGDRYRK